MSTNRTINGSFTNGDLQLINSVTVSGSASTSLPTITGLDLNSDKRYHIILNLKGAAASNGGIQMFINGDSTNNNYTFRNTTNISSTVATGLSDNVNQVGVVYASGSVTTIFIDLMLDRDGKAIMVWRSVEQSSTNLQERFGVVRYKVAANVTSIVFTNTVTNHCSVGDVAYIYKVSAQSTSGTAFPTSGLVDGQRFFRTDLGLDCFYKASITSWLTANEYTMTLTRFSTNPPFSATRNAVEQYPVPSDYQVYVTRRVFDGYVIAPNSATQYWTSSLQAVNATGTNVGAAFGATSTQSLTADNYLSQDVNINALLGSTVKVIFVYYTKVSTAGNYYPNEYLLYRKVIT